MIKNLFPTFKRWANSQRIGLQGLELVPSRRWLISPWWNPDEWSSQQSGLIRMLALASEQGLPYQPLVAAIAADHRGAYRRKLRRLAKQLQQGASLADAVERTGGVSSPAQTVAIRLGGESGALSSTLAACLEQLARVDDSPGPRLRALGNYVIGAMVLGGLLCGYILHTVMPSLRQIFREFSLELPPISDAIMAGEQWFYSYGIVLLLLLAAGTFATQHGPTWRRFHRHLLPRLSRSATTLRASDVLGLLAVTLRSGRPLAGSISTLARYHYDPRIRGGLLFVRNEIEQGANPWQAMTKAGLLQSTDASALNSAVDPQSRVWTLQQISNAKRLRTNRRLGIYVDLLHPIAVLLLGLFVLLFAVGAFTPLINIISALS